MSHGTKALIWAWISGFFAAIAVLGLLGLLHAPQAHSAPYICYDPAHAQDVLCAGAYSQRPPGYSLQDPGTWQPWPKYAPVPGGRY